MEEAPFIPGGLSAENLRVHLPKKEFLKHTSPTTLKIASAILNKEMPFSYLFLQELLLPFFFPLRT